jgi:hypothetical protein
MSLIDPLTEKEALLRLAGTPLLVVDGRAGAMRTGTIPLRQVPALVLDTLGFEAPRLPHLRMHDAPAGLWDMHRLISHLFVRDGERWRGCGDDGDDCAMAKSMLARLDVLRADLIWGDQHTLTLARERILARPTSMRLGGVHSSCHFSANAWFPATATMDRPFNTIDDGRSVIWFQLNEARGRPTLRIGPTRVRLTVGGRSATATFRDPEFLRQPGVHPVSWECDDGSGGPLGSFFVEFGSHSDEDASIQGGAPRVVHTPTDVPSAEVLADCDARIVAVSPRQVRPGERFHPQQDGASTFWVQLVPGSRGFSLKGPSGDIEFAHNRQIDAVSFRAPDGLHEALAGGRTVRFGFYCGAREVDAFEVDAAAK